MMLERKVHSYRQVNTYLLGADCTPGTEASEMKKVPLFCNEMIINEITIWRGVMIKKPRRNKFESQSIIY